LPEISVPTLVVAGDQDAITSPRYGRIVAERIPGAELLVIEGKRTSRSRRARRPSTGWSPTSVRASIGHQAAPSPEHTRGRDRSIRPTSVINHAPPAAPWEHHDRSTDMSISVFQGSIEQIWNKHNPSAIERFIASSYVGVDPAEPEVIFGIDGYRDHYARITAAFPDTHITIDHIIGVGDQVAASYTVDATHTGDFGGIPPTGRRIRITAIAIATITRGKIILEHANSDALGLLTQLGVIEDPPKVPALLF
jgi:predicted ester cyclase